MPTNITNLSTAELTRNLS